MERNGIDIEIKKAIIIILDVSEDDITSESSLKDLGADSLDSVEIMNELEKVFNIDLSPNYPSEIYSKKIGELSEYIENKLLSNQPNHK